MQSFEKWSPEKTVAGWISEDRRSLRELEKLTGVSRSKMSKLSTGMGTITATDVATISSVLGRNPRDVFGRHSSLNAVDGAHCELATKIGDALIETLEQRATKDSYSLSIDDVIGWHEVTNGHLYRADVIRPHLMAVELIDDAGQDLKVIDVGMKSLVSKKARSQGGTEAKPKDVEDFISNSIPERARQMLVQGYLDVQEQGGRQYLDRRLLHMSANGSVYMTTYFTVLMLGYWLDGSRVIWNFSKEISSRAANADELADLQGFLALE